jgi:hypothetical protein
MMQLELHSFILQSGSSTGRSSSWQDWQLPAAAIAGNQPMVCQLAVARVQQQPTSS